MIGWLSKSNQEKTQRSLKPGKPSPAFTTLEAAQGVLLGLACGSAAGAVLEFSADVTADQAAAAMRMIGEIL